MNTTWHQEVAAVVVSVGGATWPLVWAWLRTKLTPERLSHIANLADQAVRAAEETADGWGITSEQKLDFATKAVQDGARLFGVKLTDNTSYSFVQAALRDFKHAETLIEQNAAPAVSAPAAA